MGPLRQRIALVALLLVLAVLGLPAIAAALPQAPVTPGRAPEPSETPERNTEGNLIPGGSFERGADAWTTQGDGTRLDARDEGAREGQQQGLLTAGAPGGSARIDAVRGGRGGEAYAFSVWLRSVDGEPVRGRVELSGVDGPGDDQTVASTFEVGDGWTHVSAPVDLAEDYDGLRGTVVVDDPDRTLALDGALLVRNLAPGAAFETPAAWHVSAEDGVEGGSSQVGSGPGGALDGEWLGLLTSHIEGRSIVIDTTYPSGAGDSFVFSVWVRSQDGAPVDGRLRLTGIGGPSEDESASTGFTAGPTWTRVTTQLDLTGGAHQGLRSEITPETLGRGLVLDGGLLVPSALPVGTFEAGGNWQPTEGAQLDIVDTAENGPAAADGTRVGRITADDDGGRISLEALRGVEAGQSYQLSVMVRSAGDAPARGRIVVAGREGDADEEVAVRRFAAGQGWMQVNTTLEAERDHEELSAEVVLDSGDVPLDIDGALIPLSAGDPPPLDLAGASGGQLANVACPDGRTMAVNAQIAMPVQALITDAAADGVPLCGGGYRSSAQQIDLRRSHCGPSAYAIYSAPASSCSPPTARPGRSMHERGLAIDFENCSSRGSNCHRWLAHNAARYGLYNLPSEPWHWSVNGN